MPPVYNAPVAPEGPRDIESIHTESRIRSNVDDVRKYTLGPVPAQDFLDSLLPRRGAGNGRNILSSKHAFNRVPAIASSASDVHDSLLSALNKATKHKSRCPGFTFADVSCLPARPRLHANQQYLACYASDNAPTHPPSSTVPRAEFGYVEFFIDVNPDPEYDFFDDPPAGTQVPPSHSFVTTLPNERTQKRIDTLLGMHAEHVSELLSRQHRTFAFTVSLRARFMRWDRAGCLASESFDVRKRPDLFCEFLSRFSQTTPAGRGHDMSVQVASAEEESVFRDSVTSYVKQQLGVEGEELDKAVAEHYVPGHIVATHLVVEDTGTRTRSPHRFVFSRPVMSPFGAIGRGTRGYWAVDMTTSQIIFLKDTWRSTSLEPEGAIMTKLLEEGVRNVPLVVCHGDVSSGGVQKTVSDRFLHQRWVRQGDPGRAHVRPRAHYRLVLGTVGYGLERFRGTKELLHGTYDAFQAMQDAYAKDRRIHRDISLGNIILVQEADHPVRRGYLIDWEMSCRVDSDGKACSRGRVGTWYYLSINLLLFEDAIHTLQDDMESLLYVVLFCAFRWLRNNTYVDSLRPLMESIFARVDLINGYKYGGDAKLANRESRHYTSRFIFQGPVHRWLKAVMDLHQPAVGGRFVEPDLPTDRWQDPSHLEAFWSGFLASEDLPVNDRFDNLPPQPPRASFLSSLQPSSSSSLGKRKSEEEEETRRTRRFEPIPATAVASPYRLRSGRCLTGRSIPLKPAASGVAATPTVEPRYNLRNSSKATSTARHR